MTLTSTHFSDTERTKRKSSTSLREPSSVIMLSGGVDSVALLKKLLEETDEEVYAHHFHLKNNEEYNFRKEESKAVRKIVSYMKKAFRYFHYTESTIDVRQIMNLVSHDEKDLRFACVPDQIYYNFLGGILAKLTKSNIVYTGYCKEDWNSVFYGGLKEYSSENRGKFIRDKIQEGASYPYKIPLKNTWENPLSKREEIEYLGKELMDMVWYCRHPIEKNGKILSCNTNLGIYTSSIDSETGEIYRCRACTDVSKALIEMEEEGQRGIKYG